jgi:hypothetical protein
VLRRFHRPLGRQLAISVAACFAAGCGAYPLALPGSDGIPRLGDEELTERTTGLNAAFVKTVVLDWTGGDAGVVDTRLNPSDLAQMYLNTAETLDVYSAVFRQDVRDRIEEILSAIEPVEFVVLNGEDGDYPRDTVVYFTGDAAASEAYHVGQTRQDYCDLDQEGSVIVWIGTLLKLGDLHTYNQWVNALANIAAHEIGHTIGFHHPDTEGGEYTQHERDTEIMMSTHTLSSLLGRQEFIIPQETCPAWADSSGAGIAYELDPAATAKPPAFRYAGRTAQDDVLVTH